jgi:predicted O-methyltransferase YrrM
MLSKLQTLFWYFKNPKLLPDAFFKLRTSLFQKAKENTEQLAVDWCKANEMNQEEAFALFFPGHEFLSVQKEFADTYAYALQKEKECRFVMGGPGAIDLLYNFCEAIQSSRVLETGVAYGWSTLAILLSLNKRAGAQLVSIDMPYAKMGNDDVVGVAVPGSLRSPWKLLRESDYTGVPKAIRYLKEIDLCHYDSDKSYAGRMRSNPMIWEALREGGIFISDDISDNLGFKDFCASVNRTPVIVNWGNKYIGILKK